MRGGASSPHSTPRPALTFPGRHENRHALRPARLPPVRRRPRGPRAPARGHAFPARRARHRERRRSAAPLPRAHPRRRRRRPRAVGLLRRRGRPQGGAIVSRLMTPDVMSQPERLSLGVAARLSRCLQVLTQAKKEGKETISSQDLSRWTHVNSTQIRRDLSGFGKFGKRGVGYNVDSLVSQIRKILRTAGQHNIALFGAGHLGKAIASSDIFADHGFRVVAIFDANPKKVGQKVGQQTVRAVEDLRQTVLDEDIVVAVLAVPTAAAQPLADELVDAGVKIIFNYSEALLQVPPEVTVHPSSPAVDLLYALYFYLT